MHSLKPGLELRNNSLMKSMLKKLYRFLEQNELIEDKMKNSQTYLRYKTLIAAVVVYKISAS